MRPIIGITWLQQRRMTEMCAALGIELYTLVSPHKGVRRYLELGWRTLGMLIRRRPSVVVAQNPSMVLVLFALVFRPVLRFRLVVDAHNEAVEPFINNKRWALWLARRFMRSADLTIVTNRWLARVVEQNGGQPFVLPDALPKPPSQTSRSVKHWPEAGTLRIAVIASYAPDEPIAELLGVAQQFVGQAQLTLTGNYRKLSTEVRNQVSSNVRFTGFLEDQEYWDLLHTADIVIDLTLMDHCLVSGAYEAAAVGKMAILSGNQATREWFSGTAVFTDNSSADIARAIRELLAAGESGRRVPPQVIERMRLDWQQKGNSLMHTMQHFDKRAERQRRSELDESP